MENSRKHSLELPHKKVGSAVLSQCLSLAYFDDVFVEDHLGKVFYVFAIDERDQEAASDYFAHPQLGGLD